MRHRQRQIILIIFLCFLVVTLLISPVQSVTNTIDYSQSFSHQEIITQGLLLGYEQEDLVTWYTAHPQIRFASLIHDSITVQFIDGSYTIVFLDSPTALAIPDSIYELDTSSPLITRGYSATLLNPFEEMYGNHQCKQIIGTLLRRGYNVNYLSNEDVNISFMKDHLTADIVYMNTHAGYWDIDGDQQADAVVIGTGEPWTNKTEQLYQFEIEHHLIVEGVVGGNSVVSFTPSFIEYFYDPGDLPGSLIYMATCHATFDDSMAEPFLQAGASVYMGWTQSTFFITNSRTSIQVFRLFALGLPANLVCKVIGYGGLINRILRSKLTYIGDGQYTIPRH